MKISKENDQRIYEGKIFDLYERTIKYPDGKIAKYDVLTHNGAAAIVPIDKNRNFWFVRQYRPAIEEYLLEIPAGFFAG
jgi:ADP-ribose pyrophosphatase